ncbi:glucose receptor git3 protein [Colletotrichum scovillei]|uniref:Glucose receptor git3 protein n=1 Tax=Colletotrichum scovillei TaxID=1209932 RepID=A0A9P7R3V6_9PEZI|nr:glucose receptor git3 protein [Colletotrichum scovillei]KAG7065417.1 glucose receptor git3 protein [Colletotrichum scovillei]KAG7068020.1 glucose receptor git3 protein [Colletotrichum scovillei]
MVPMRVAVVLVMSGMTQTERQIMTFRKVDAFGIEEGDDRNGEDGEVRRLHRELANHAVEHACCARLEFFVLDVDDARNRVAKTRAWRKDR